MEKAAIKSLIITYGILLGVTSVLMAVVKYVISSNILEKSIMESILGVVITIVFIVIPIRIYKNNNKGQLSLSDSFKLGLGISAISGLIGALYFFIFANYIQVDFANNLVNIQMKEAMESNPNVSSEQMKQGMEMAKRFIMPMFYAMIIITNMFFGFVTSLIAGLALRKQ